MNHRVLILAAGLWLAGAGGSAAQTGALRSTDDRPRFFTVAIAGKPPVDASDAPVLRRRVTANLSHVPLGDALHEIGRQVGIRFAVSPEMVPVNWPVSLRATDITLGAALFEVLGGLGLDVQFTPDGRGAAIVRRGAFAGVAQSQGSLVGRVTDSMTGKGIARAEVFLDGTRWQTETDTNGRYRLEEVEARSYTLSVRRLGYRKVSRRVTVRAEREDTVNVTLVPTAVPLNELVTTATGIQRRRDIGNAITTIKADSVMRTAPIRNLTDLLQDRVPGLTVQHTSGAPGDPARLRLRGLGSVQRSNDPVVVVDGMRVYATQSEARSGNLTNLCATVDGNGRCQSSGTVPAPSPLDQIDPNIIDKIEVLKGPSAATLYGADAANGVIVVTTKRGKPGPTRWNATLTFGQERPLGRYPTGYYRWAHYALSDTTSPSTICKLTDYCVQDSLVRFQALNVPSLTVLGRGHSTGASLTTSGGTQSLTYSITGSYNKDVGLLQLPAFEVERFRTTFNREAPDWMRRPHQFTQWTVTSNVMARLGATADATLFATVGRTEQQRTSLENQLAKLSGTYADTINKVYYRAGENAGSTSADILQDYYVHTTASSTKLTTGLNASWRPKSWFDASGVASIDINPRTDASLLAAGLATPTDSGSVIRGTGQSFLSTLDLHGRIHRPLRWGFIFQTVVGANLNTMNTQDIATSASGLIPGSSTFAGAKRIAAADGQTKSSVFGWAIEPSIMGQRLSLSTGIRLDGGSTYGTRVSGLLGLPKLNGSWVISEEPWFPFKPLFSSLRLRGAYGKAQVQPGAADRLRLYQYSTLDQPSVELTSLGNTQLRPERAAEIEGGFDADLFDSRMSLEISAYRKTQVDALMQVTLPPSVNGASANNFVAANSVWINIGTIRNSGLDATLMLVPMRSSAMTWSNTLIFNSNRNELVALGRGVPTNYQEGLVAGYPVRSRWERPILGYSDQNGDGVLQEREILVGDSAVYVGRLLPAYTMSLQTSVALFTSAVRISAGFSYAAGQTQIDQTARDNWVLSRAMVDPSTPLSQQAAVLTSNLSYSPKATLYGVMQEVSTLRFRTFSVNYRAPMSMARLIRAQTLSVALQGNNLALHSTYRGKDPDVTAWGPGERIVDTGQLAQPVTWQMRIDLQY